MYESIIQAGIQWDNTGCDTSIIGAKRSPAIKYQSNITNNSFDIYPIPANDILYINLPATTGEKELRLYDFSGKLIYKVYIAKDDRLFQFSLRSYSPGMYAIQLMEAGKSIFASKFIINSN